MRAIVDGNICQGHTLCNRAAPEIFFLNDEDGHAYVAVDEVPSEHEVAVRAAVRGCPERAIRIED